MKLHTSTDPATDPALALRHVLVDADMALRGSESAAETIAAGRVSDPADAELQARLGAAIASDVAMVRSRLRAALAHLPAMAAVLALALAAVLAPSGPSAQAVEAPEPDRATVTVTLKVTLNAPTVHLAVPVVAGVLPGGWHCAAVWRGYDLLGQGCARTPLVRVPVTLDARTLPAGRSLLVLTDGANPGHQLRAVVEARRPSRFGVGTWTDLHDGNLYIAAPVLLWSQAAGRWLPQNGAPVYVQELTRAGWRTRATLTSRRGVAAGLVHLGLGKHTVRVQRPQGDTVTATTGTTRTVASVPTTEPWDVI